MQAAPVDGVDIRSESAGTGPAIVLVHGWTCDTSSWREQLPVFDDDYHAIALDLPGHGQSEPPADGRFSMDAFARAVEAVRAEAGTDEIVLVGHSMGAVVIKQYAILYQDRVAGLAAVEGPLDLSAFGNVATPPVLSPEARQAMIRGLFVPETSPDRYGHILEMMLGAPVFSIVPQCPVPGRQSSSMESSTEPVGD